jgi:NhaP-type Na+/H+ or K+/H+ antiporter
VPDWDRTLDRRGTAFGVGVYPVSDAMNEVDPVYHFCTTAICAIAVGLSVGYIAWWLFSEITKEL